MQPESVRPGGERMDEPWYKRKRIVIPLAIVLLLVLWLLPPLVAGAAPVGLSEDGERQIRSGGWSEDEQDPLSLAGGLVSIEFALFNKGQAAAYSYASVEIQLMLPGFIVAPQLHDGLIDALEEQGVRADPETERESDYSANGEDATVWTMTGSTTGGYGDLPTGIPVDLFIAVWPCSTFAGTWGLAVGVAAQGTGGSGGGGFPFAFGSSPALEPASYAEMRDQLLPETRCE